MNVFLKVAKIENITLQKRKNVTGIKNKKSFITSVV